MLLERIDGANGDIAPHLDLVWAVVRGGPSVQDTEPGSDWLKLYGVVVKWLKGRAKDEWMKTLQGWSRREVGLAKVLAAKGKGPELGHNFKEALVDYGDLLITGQMQMPATIQASELTEWEDLPTLIEDAAHREDLAETLVGRAANRFPNPVDPSFWRIFGPFLAGEAKVHKHARLGTVIGEAVRARDESTLEWAAAMFETHLKALSSLTRNKRKVLEELLEEELRKADAPDAVKRLASAIDVKVEDDEPE